MLYTVSYKLEQTVWIQHYHLQPSLCSQTGLSKLRDCANWRVDLASWRSGGSKWKIEEMEAIASTNLAVSYWNARTNSHLLQQILWSEEVNKFPLNWKCEWFWININVNSNTLSSSTCVCSKITTPLKCLQVSVNLNPHQLRCWPKFMENYIPNHTRSPSQWCQCWEENSL